MTTLWHDIRYAARGLARSPAFTIVALLSLALGIGANTAIFSVVNGVLLKSLPVRDPQDLRVIGWTGSDIAVGGGLTSDSFGRTKSGDRFCMSFPYPAYRDFVENAEGFSHLFAFSFLEESMTVKAGGVATVAHGLMVSGNFFEGYGARVLIGRPIEEQDDQPGAEPVAVITYHFWQRHYDLDPHALGRTFMVNDATFTIVGVLPQWYRGPLSGDPTDFYVPITAQPQITFEDNFEHSWLMRSDRWWVRVMGRLAPEASEARAHASLGALFRQLVDTSKARITQPRVVLQDGKRGLAMSYFGPGSVLVFLQVLVGVVLLVACVNGASLLLARGAARRHEMSVRAAMGAGRWRLIRQSLVESLVLSLGAAVLGLVLSIGIKAAITGSVTGLLRQMQGDLEYMGDPSARIHLAHGIDAMVLLFTLGIGLFTTVLFGLIPALRAAHVDPSAELKHNAGYVAPRLRLGGALIAVQTALSLVLVTGAVLLTRTMVNLRRVDPGFDTENLLVFRINPLESTHERANLAGFFDDVRATIAGIPGVRSVALSHLTLPSGGWYTDLLIPGRSTDETTVQTYIVSDEWFATMGVGLLAGRDFTVADTRGSQPVVIINEAFTREFFPGENSLGRSLKTEDEEYRVVGICSNHRDSVRSEVCPRIYLCQRQSLLRRVTVAVRSVLPPLSLVPAVRRAVARIDPGLPLEGVTTQALLLEESLALERTLAALYISLALLALGLCCIGLYGLMAYNVARRTGEIGIRMALGARPVDVARPILRDAGLLALIGIAIGVPMALALARILGAVIFGIAPYDLVSMTVSGLALLAAAVAAAWLPARRAAKVDPMEALRYE